MKPFVPNELVREFELRTRAKIHKDLESWLHLKRQQRTHKNEQETQDEQFETAFLAAIASFEDVALFKSNLDDLHQTAIERIIRLQHELDDRAVERQALLETAYVLPDGRYVLRSEDGNAVFFEDGTAVDPQIISPEQIGDENLTMNHLQAFDTDTESIKSKLDEAITFNDKIEDLQSRSDKTEMTNGELKSFQSELDTLKLESLEMDNHHTENAPSNTVDVSEQAEISITPFGLPKN